MPVNVDNTAEKVNEAGKVVDAATDVFNSGKQGKTPEQTAAENKLNQKRVAAKAQLPVLENNASQLVAFLNANGQKTYNNYLSDLVAGWRIIKFNPTTYKGGELLNYETRTASAIVLDWMLSEPSFGGESGLMTMNLYAQTAPPTPTDMPGDNGSSPSQFPSWLPWAAGALTLLGIGIALLKGKKGKALGNAIVDATAQLAGTKKKSMTFNF